MENTKPLDDDLLSIIEPVKYKLSETTFVRKWLPLFYGTFKRKGESPIGLWIDQVCRGHADIEVDVINSNGEVLYTIPTIIKPFNTIAIHQDKYRKAPSFRDTMSMAHSFADTFPAKAKAIREKAIESYVGLDHGETDLEEWKLWSSLFERYGYPPIEVPEQFTTTDPAIESSDDWGDEFNDA